MEHRYSHGWSSFRNGILNCFVKLLSRLCVAQLPMTQSTASRSAESLDRALLRARLERARELKRQEEERTKSATLKKPSAAKRESRAAPQAQEDELAAVTALEQCSVCCMDMEPDDSELQVLGCSHCFHQPCISPWLKRSQTCPLCRQPVRVGVDIKAETPSAAAARPPARWECGTRASQGRAEPSQRPRRKHSCNAPSVIIWSEQYYCEGCHRWLRYFEDPP